MNPEEFRKNAHSVVDWLADYYKSIEKYPVKSLVRPGEIFEQIPDQAPDEQESFEQLMLDVDSKIMPGITHWQHPNFHAFFPANTSFPSILAEMITAGLGAQCMIWETSPAAAELEEKMALWFKAAMGLPADWHGVIQDTASTATLAALLTAREQKTGYHINEKGFDSRRLRVYCSTQTHSSIDKAVKIAGFGSENLVKIAVDTHMAMDPDALEAAIIADTQNGMVPCAVVSTLGTTSTLAFDPIKRIGALCRKFNIWHHVDAAYAGSAWVLPEMRGLATGLDTADSYVFNPHKWLFTNFDCSMYYVRDKEALLRTFEILPEYLKTGTRGIVNDYRDWGVPLGRRFRALKLWFVLRSYGLNGIRKRLREHLSYAEWLEQEIMKHPDFELMLPRSLNMLVFRLHPAGYTGDLNALNQEFLGALNASGKAYLTHTKLKENYVIRLVTGQTYLQQKHVEGVWEIIVNQANKYL